MLAESAICVALSALFMILGSYLPLLSLPMMVVAGSPIFYLGIRYPLRYGALATVAAVLVLVILTANPLSAVMMGLLCLLPGIAMGYGYRRGMKYTSVILLGGGVALLGLLLPLMMLNSTNGGNGIATMIQGSVESLRPMAEEAIALMSEKNLEQGQMLQRMWNQALDQVGSLILLYLPTFVIGAAVLLSYCSLAVAIFLVRRVRRVSIPYQPFSEFSATRGMTYLTMVLFLITTFTEDRSVWTAALQNMMLLFYGYFTICGLSVIDAKWKKKIPSGYGRAMIYLVVLIVGYMFMSLILQLLSVLGMIDSMLNFRRLHKAGDHHVGHR